MMYKGDGKSVTGISTGRACYDQCVDRNITESLPCAAWNWVPANKTCILITDPKSKQVEATGIFSGNNPISNPIDEYDYDY